MRFAIDEQGVSCVVDGDAGELERLIEVIQRALEVGEAEGQLLGDEGVETLRVRCFDDWAG